MQAVDWFHYFYFATELKRFQLPGEEDRSKKFCRETIQHCVAHAFDIF